MGNFDHDTHYLSADLDVKLCSTIPGELLSSSELKESHGPFDMGFPVAISPPSLKVDSLHAIKSTLACHVVEHTSNSPNKMTAVKVVSAIAWTGLFKACFMATKASPYCCLDLDAI